jgi:hypothetical protein
MSNRTTGRSPAHSAPNPPAPISAPRRERGPRVPRDDDPAVAPAVRFRVVQGEPAEHLFRRLLSSYLGGARAFEVIETPRLSTGTRAVVREFCRRTRQPEIVREGGDRLAIVEPDDGPAGSLDERLLRLGRLVVAFHQEAVASWGQLVFGDDGYWSRRDDDVDREAWLLERSIALGEAGGTGRARPATGAWTVARSLERIADHAVTLGEVGPRLADLAPGASPLRELRQFHRQAMDHLEGVLAQPDGARSNDLLDVGEALVAGGRALGEQLLPAVGDGTMTPASAAAVARALEAIGRTVAYGQDIAQAFLDRRLEPLGPAPSLTVVPTAQVAAR